MENDYFLSYGLAGEQGDQTLDFDKSPTVQLVFAANRFTRNASRYYQDKYDIGAMDWRMLVMLTKEPDCSAANASKVIGIDKAAVSRSLSRLEAKQLVIAKALESDPRRKNWRLTKAGEDLHAEILKDALSRQNTLLTGFNNDEVETLNRLLKKLRENIDLLE